MLKRLIAVVTISVSLLACTKKSDVAENSLQIPLAANLSSLDPSQSSNLYANTVVSNIYETLLQYHYLKRPLVVTPLLADGLPEVSKDGLTHTFKIKKGIKFHDSEAFKDGKGREVTAQDFIYSWRRLADPQTKSEGWWVFDGRIKGFNEWRDKLIKGEATYDTPIEGLTAKDNNTLVITLAKPFFQLHYVLTMPFTAVVAKEAVEKWGPEFMNHPVGTGPFVFDTWIRGNKVVLKRNKNYHQDTFPTEGEPSDTEKGLLVDAGKPVPFIDELIFQEVPEDQPRWLNLMKGNFDYAGIPKDNFDSAVVNKTELKPEFKQKDFRVSIDPAMDVVYIAFNMEDPILGKNVELRRALSYAYDGATAMEKFYNNRVIAAQSPLAPNMEGYDPEFKNPYKEFNLEKAKEALKKAGYPDGKGLPVFEYSFTGSTTGRQMAEYVSQQWEKIGVKLNLVSNSWPQFQDRLRNKKSQIFGIAWGADYPDAENMLQLLYGKNVSPGSNSSNYKNPEFDRLYEKAALLPPSPQRTALYKEMRDIFVKDLPWIPTVHRLNYTMIHGWVNNFKPNDVISGYHKYLRVDSKKRTETKAKL